MVINPYGLHGAPAVGGGLPGLPRRIATGGAVLDMIPLGGSISLDRPLQDPRFELNRIFHYSEYPGLREATEYVPVYNLEIGGSPSGQSFEAGWDPSGTYLVRAHNFGVYTFYKRLGSRLVVMPSVSVAGSWGRSMHWHPSGEFVVVGYQSGVACLQRDGDSLVMGPNVPSLPTELCRAVRWSPDGQFLVCLFGSTDVSASSRIRLYSFDGENFTRVTISSPPAAGSCLDWHPSGTLFSVGLLGTPFIANYRLASGSWSLLSNPSQLPGASSYVGGIAWYPNGSRVILHHNASSSNARCSLYSYNGVTSFIKLESPSDWPTTGNPSNTGNSLSWSPEVPGIPHRVLAAAYQSITSPIRRFILGSDGITLTSGGSPSIGVSSVNSPVWSPDCLYIGAVGDSDGVIELRSHLINLGSNYFVPQPYTVGGYQYVKVRL